MKPITGAALSELTTKERRALFVRVGMPNQPDGVKQIPRFRLNPANVNRVFNCDVEYLQEDATGTVVWPQNWVTDCLPPPYLYFVHEKQWPQLDPDIVEVDEYRGKSIVVVDNAPEEATKEVVLTWLNAGMDDDDPELATAKTRLLDMQRRLEDVKQEIKELPTLKGEGNNAQEELDNKRKKAENLSLRKSDLEAAINKINERTAQIARDRLSGGSDSGFTIRLAETKMPMRLNVWELRFGRDQKAQRQAYVAVHKYNWSEFRVAVHRRTQEIIVGKVELEGLTDDFAEINMRNITVSRRRHGVGMFKYADERGFYSGNFRHGLRHGMGTEINMQGRFQGEFNRDWRLGAGTQVSPNGDSFRGPYGGSRHHVRESFIFGDEYNDGQRHGLGRFRFVDGSVYDGSFKDGVPCGPGKYVSSAGVIVEGTFDEWGGLIGPGSSTVDDVTRIGTFRRGLIHGRGTEIDLKVGTYEGDFKRGERHGFGKLLSSVLDGGVHVGWYHHGARWGRGVLNFGNTSRDKDAAEARVKKLAMAMKEASRATLGTGAGEEIPEAFWATNDPPGQGEAATNGGGSGGGTDSTRSAVAAATRDHGPSGHVDHLSSAAAPSGHVVDPRVRAAQQAVPRGGLKTLTGTAGALPDLPPASVKGRVIGRIGPTYAPEELGEEDEEDDHEVEIDDDLDGDGDGSRGEHHPRKSEYEKMKSKSETFLPYRGDYCYEGRWRAGQVRSGGIFTMRLGRTEPHLHHLQLTTSGANSHLPGLGELSEKELELETRRLKELRARNKEALDNRLKKQAENLSSFLYWKRFAERQQKYVRRKTRRAKSAFHQLRDLIKRPARKDDDDDDAVDAIDDEDYGEEESKVADDDNRPGSATAEPVIAGADDGAL